MEYNMNEAKKAMHNAEKKITENNFNDAKRFAVTAQSLCPDLVGLKELMMMIVVHISAMKTIGKGVTDLYGILGVDHLATYDVMKKQFRKLLLALHPDKNKNKGVEASCRGAYELVVKAWDILSDKDKRLEYNIRCGFEAGQRLETMTHVLEGVQNVGEDVGSSSRARPKRDRPAQKDVGPISGARPKRGCPAQEDEGFGSRARPMHGHPAREDVGPISGERPKRGRLAREDVGSISGERPKRGRPAREDVGSISGERPKRGRPSREDIGSSSRGRPKLARSAREDEGSSSVARPKRGRPAGSSRGARSNKSGRAATRANKSRMGSVSPTADESGTFWTKCDKCTTHYRHPRDFINKTLICQDCDRGFVAEEITSVWTTCKNKKCRTQHKYPRSYLYRNLTCDDCGHGFLAVENTPSSSVQKSIVIFSHGASSRKEPAPYVNHNYEWGSSSTVAGSNTINAIDQAVIVFQEVQGNLKRGSEECQEKDEAEEFTQTEASKSNTPNVVHVDGESQEKDSDMNNFDITKWIEEFLEPEPEPEPDMNNFDITKWMEEFEPDMKNFDIFDI